MAIVQISSNFGYITCCDKSCLYRDIHQRCGVAGDVVHHPNLHAAHPLGHWSLNKNCAGCRNCWTNISYLFNLQVSQPPTLGFLDAKCMLNDHTGRIELPVNTPLPFSQVANISVIRHALRHAMCIPCGTRDWVSSSLRWPTSLTQNALA